MGFGTLFPYYHPEKHWETIEMHYPQKKPLEFFFHFAIKLCFSSRPKTNLTLEVEQIHKVSNIMEVSVTKLT